MKKSQCLFFTRSIFLSKSKSFWGENWPFQRPKSCTKPMQVCSFWTTLMLGWWPTGYKKRSFRFYFTNFVCKRIGIIFLYNFPWKILEDNIYNKDNLWPAASRWAAKKLFAWKIIEDNMDNKDNLWPAASCWEAKKLSLLFKLSFEYYRNFTAWFG